MFSIQSKIGYIHKLLVDELKLNIMKTKIGKAKEINSLRMNVEAYLENNKGRGNKKETD